MTNVDRRAEKAPSLFDIKKFSAWLRRWRDAEGFQWGELADRAGISVSALQGLAKPTGPGNRPTRSGYDPSVSLIYRLAVALDLDMGYLLEKAGMPGVGSRWNAFTFSERIALAQAIAAADANPLVAQTTQATLQRLNNELAAVLMPSPKEDQ